MEKLAIHGGSPVRSEPLPIFKLSLEANELDRLIAVAKSGQLSRGQGPVAFESAFSKLVESANSVVVSSGTAALHLAVQSLELPPGCEVILPSLTFVATAWALEYCGLVPRFCEIDPCSFNATAETIEARITPQSKALLPVHYGGQVAPLSEIHDLARANGLLIVEDAAHAVGAVYHGNGPESRSPVGSCRYSDLTTFSFFATKNITGGEGGAVTTDDASLAEKVRRARSFGLKPLSPPLSFPGSYDAAALGYNYHLSNLSIGLLEEQLPRLDRFNRMRRQHASVLTGGLRGVPGIAYLPEYQGPEHVYHLYTIQLDLPALRASRLEIAEAVKAEGVSVGFYYPPVHLFSYFRRKYGWKRGDLPITESVTDCLLTLPMYPILEQQDLEDIVAAVTKVLGYYRR